MTDERREGERELEELLLSERTYRIAKRGGIDTTTDLFRRTVVDLLALKGMGRKSLNELRDAVAGIPGAEEWVDSFPTPPPRTEVLVDYPPPVMTELPPPRRIHVYFIRCDQFVKIGITDYPTARVRAMQTGNPFQLDLLASKVYGSYAEALVEEKRLHARFADLHERGEWFRFEGDLAEFVSAEVSKAEAA